MEHNEKHGIQLSEQIFVVYEYLKKRRRKALKLLNEIMVENIPSLERYMDIQIQEAQSRLHQKILSPKLIIIKLSKVKGEERILKTVTENHQVTYRLTADFSAETLQTRREWGDIFKDLKRKKLPAKNIFYPVKLFFRSEEK